MNFFQAINTGFKKCFDFNGRASRSEFWYFALFLTLLCYFALFISIKVEGVSWDQYINRSGIFLSTIDLIVYSLTNILFLSLWFRRLHDVNRSVWWMLIALTGIGLFFPLLYWFCKKGDESENRFGNNPLKS